MRVSKSTFLCVLTVAVCLYASTAHGSSWFRIEDMEQWDQALTGSEPNKPSVKPMDATEWQEYMYHWYGDPDCQREGEPYPDSEFLPAALEAYPGGGEWTDPCTGEVYPYPDDAGLVMSWMSEPPPAEGDYASAWVLDYGLDPDLRNCTIKVSVTPPSGCNINAVSFAIQDVMGRRRSWWWKVPGVIPYDVPTTVVIKTNKTGTTAAVPQASGYASHINFDLKKAQFFDVDENGKYVFGMAPVPPPGQMQFMWMWNYWHNLIVLPNTGEGKCFIKWSQPPVLFDPNIPGLFYGWDDISMYEWRPILADDWLCEDERPITDIHWWGSYLGWDQPYPPPVVPKAFHIGIWTDVPDPDPNDPIDFSHPGVLIWQNFCDNWVWNFAGYDEFPMVDPSPDGEFEFKETCFQFNQLLSQDEWFYQEPNDLWDDDPNSTVYWLSIAAIYDPDAYIEHPWGWKTRPHFFNDDAVRIWDTWLPDGMPAWPPTMGAEWFEGEPIWWPDPNTSWDLAFELTTNEPTPEPPDVNAPLPDPMTWELVPTKIGSTAIMMTATTATDPSGGIQYYFQEMTGNPGGDNSGWQNSSGYVDVGLDPNTTYTYRVKASDSNMNQTQWSAPASETTAPICADLYKDVNNIVNFKDLAVLANQWLTSCP